jgi:ribonuclease BN (tRNA processing enzyme)
MAGRTGREAKAKQLALFHIPPPNDHREDEFFREATQEYGNEVTLATDLATIEI